MIALTHESQIKGSTTYYRDLEVDQTILRVELLRAKGHREQSDDVYVRMIRSLEEKCWWLPVVKCRARYGMSLARCGALERARAQFDEAMIVAKRVGSEKRVRLAATRVGLSL